MEEALNLSTNAHLIMEAASPHRVIHANAAFQRMSLPPPVSSMQSTMPTTTTAAATFGNASDATTTTTLHQSLGTNVQNNNHNNNWRTTHDVAGMTEEIRSIYGNRIATLYPVCATAGADPRHYLIEVSLERRAGPMDQPAMTVA